eukprot:4174733-Heterocapsa_arctica.AAC.1
MQLEAGDTTTRLRLLQPIVAGAQALTKVLRLSQPDVICLPVAEWVQATQQTCSVPSATSEAGQ